jgi:hypothetical protein
MMTLFVGKKFKDIDSPFLSQSIGKTEESIKKEWEFSQNSGFESIFPKGIIRQYFNFKKPRFWI